MASTSTRDTVKLQSKDGDVFAVKAEVAKVSRTIATMLEDLGYEEDDIIPLPNVDTRILKKVLAWAEHLVEEAEEENSATAAGSSPSPTLPVAETTSVVQPRVHTQPRVPQRTPRKVTNATGHQLSLWDSEFLVRNRQDIYSLLLAANYLDIKGLLDIICRSIAEVIKGKDPEEIRRTFSASDPSFNMMDSVEQVTDLNSGPPPPRPKETASHTQTSCGWITSPLHEKGVASVKTNEHLLALKPWQTWSPHLDRYWMQQLTLSSYSAAVRGSGYKTNIILVPAWIKSPWTGYETTQQADSTKMEEKWVFTKEEVVSKADQLASDMNPPRMLRELIRWNVLDYHDYQQVMQQPNDRSKNSKMLDLLEERDPETALPALTRSLRLLHPNLAETLRPVNTSVLWLVATPSLAAHVIHSLPSYVTFNHVEVGAGYLFRQALLSSEKNDETVLLCLVFPCETTLSEASSKALMTAIESRGLALTSTSDKPIKKLVVTSGTCTGSKARDSAVKSDTDKARDSAAKGDTDKARDSAAKGVKGDKARDSAVKGNKERDSAVKSGKALDKERDSAVKSGKALDKEHDSAVKSGKALDKERDSAVKSGKALDKPCDSAANRSSSMDSSGSSSSSDEPPVGTVIITVTSPIDDALDHAVKAQASKGDVIVNRSPLAHQWDWEKHVAVKCDGVIKVLDDTDIAMKNSSLILFNIISNL